MPQAATAFRFVPVADANTLSNDFVDLLVVSPDVAVYLTTDILLSFTASIEVTPPASTNFQGAEVRFLWDGTPLSDSAWFEMDPGNISTAFDTFATVLVLRSLVPAVTPGIHTLSVQWRTIDAAMLNAFVGSGNLTIEGK
jgi:hypothetical protein